MVMCTVMFMRSVAFACKNGTCCKLFELTFYNVISKTLVKFVFLLYNIIYNSVIDLSSG